MCRHYDILSILQREGNIALMWTLTLLNALVQHHEVK